MSGTVAQRIGRGDELHRRRPQRAAGIVDFHGLVVRNRRGQLQVKTVFNSQIIIDERRVKGAAFETNRLYGHGLPVHGHGKRRERGRSQIGPRR